MASIIRMGFIGGGRALQEIHLPLFSQMEEVLPLVLCDVRESALQSAVRKFGLREATTHFEDVLAMRDLDAIVIALPNDLHAKVAERALRAGKHVLCETPAALRPEEAEALTRAARESGSLYTLALPHRFAPEIVQLRRMIEGGRLGRVQHVRAGIVQRHARPEGWRVDPARSGGGAFMHLGTHLLDLITLLMRALPSRASAVTSMHGSPVDEAGGSSVEDAATVLLRFGDGRSAVIETAWNRDVEDDRQYLEVFGDRGGASAWPLRLIGEVDGLPAVVAPQLALARPYQGLARHFIEQISRLQRGERVAENSPSAADGHRLAVLTRHIYQSAAEGREIEITVVPAAKSSKGA